MSSTPHVSVLWLRRLRFLLETVSCDWCNGIKRVGQYTRLSIGEVILVTLLKNTHFETRGAKAPCLAPCLTFRIRERMFQERKFQGATVPPMVLSLLGAKVRVNESSSYPFALGRTVYTIHNVTDRRRRRTQHGSNSATVLCTVG